jgi:hypothetical protein
MTFSSLWWRQVYGNCTEPRAFFEVAPPGVCAARPAELPPHPAWREELTCADAASQLAGKRVPRSAPPGKASEGAPGNTIVWHDEAKEKGRGPGR